MLAEGEREVPVWVTSCSGRGCAGSAMFWFDSVVETAEEASGWTSAVNTEASSEELVLVLGSKDRVTVAVSEENLWVVGTSGASVLWSVLRVNGLKDLIWFPFAADCSTVRCVASKVGLDVS